MHTSTVKHFKHTQTVHTAQANISKICPSESLESNKFFRYSSNATIRKRLVAISELSGLSAVCNTPQILRYFNQQVSILKTFYALALTAQGL